MSGLGLVITIVSIGAVGFNSIKRVIKINAISKRLSSLTAEF